MVRDSANEPERYHEPMSPAQKSLQAVQDIWTAQRYQKVSGKLRQLAERAGEDHWYPNTIIRLWTGLVAEYGRLQDAYIEREPQVPYTVPCVLAWRTRNLLELSIWSCCCLNRKESAREFYADRTRDFVDWTNTATVSASATRDESTQIQLRRIAEAAASMLWDAEKEGLTNLDDPYTHVHDAARQLGLGEVFSRLNRFLSKFCHPTALSVLTTPSESAIVESGDLFFTLGAGFFLLAFNEYESFFRSRKRRQRRKVRGQH
jgi:hypothetical protein